jgi:4-hydroxybenzoate polyprenyltransferase
MSQLASKRRAKTLSVALFLVGLAIITYLNAWWPGIMLAIGIPLALRQYLLGRRFDMGMTLFVFIGVFVTVQFDISWQRILPVLFALGGIYILFREYLESKEEPLEEEEEDMNQEIEEEQHK